MFKLWINNIPIVTIPYSNAKSVTLMILQLIRLEYIHGHCCSWWMMDIAFCQVFLLSCSATLFTAVFFHQKAAISKISLCFCAGFWSSLQTTLAQPKDFDRLLLTHLRQKDLILLTWIIEIFPLETWNCFRRLGIASWRLELAPEDLFAQHTGRNVELFYRFLRFW